MIINCLKYCNINFLHKTLMKNFYSSPSASLGIACDGMETSLHHGGAHVFGQQR